MTEEKGEKPADYLVLAPISIRVSDDREFKDYLKYSLMGKEAKHGDILTIDILKHRVEFHVIYTMPRGKVKITPATEILFEPNIVANR
jgi:hypothetical protein